MCKRGITQYEVDHQENIMLIDSHWPDTEDDWDESEVFEDDDIDDW